MDYLVPWISPCFNAALCPVRPPGEACHEYQHGRRSSQTQRGQQGAGRNGPRRQDDSRCDKMCIKMCIMTYHDSPGLSLYHLVSLYVHNAWERVGKARNIAFPAQGVPHPSIGTAPAELTYVGANHQRPTGPYASLVKSNHDINHGQVANRCKIRHPNP